MTPFLAFLSKILSSLSLTVDVGPLLKYNSAFKLQSVINISDLSIRLNLRWVLLQIINWEIFDWWKPLLFLNNLLILQNNPFHPQTNVQYIHNELVQMTRIYFYFPLNRSRHWTIWVCQPLPPLLLLIHQMTSKIMMQGNLLEVFWVNQSCWEKGLLPYNLKRQMKKFDWTFCLSRQRLLFLESPKYGRKLYFFIYYLLLFPKQHRSRVKTSFAIKTSTHIFIITSNTGYIKSRRNRGSLYIFTENIWPMRLVSLV